MMAKNIANKLSLWLLIIFATLTMNACSRVNEDAFKALIPSSIISLNSHIQASIPKSLVMESGTNMPKETRVLDANNLRAGEKILLEIKNFSSELIVFQEETALRFFIYDEMNKQWIEVDKVKKEYWPVLPPGLEPQVYLYPKGPDHPLGLIGLSDEPVLEGISSPEKIRILVIGDVYSDDMPTGKQVGAYIDAIIKP